MDSRIFVARYNLFIRLFYVALLILRRMNLHFVHFGLIMSKWAGAID